MSKRPFPSGEGRRRQIGLLLGSTVLGVAALAGMLAAVRRSSEMATTPFVAENRAAMVTMMAGMDILPSGDADRDFATMMIAHHQGAIAMAQAELRHGRNEQLRRLAQGIVVEQQQEIAAIRIALENVSLTPSRAMCTGLSVSATRGGANDTP